MQPCRICWVLLAALLSVHAEATTGQRLESAPSEPVRTTLDVTEESNGARVRWSVLIRPPYGKVLIHRRHAARTRASFTGHGFYVLTAKIGSGTAAFKRDVAIEVASIDRPVEAGLEEPFQLPPPLRGRTLTVTDFGATPNDPSNDDGAAVNAALRAVRPGDRIVFPPGEFHFESTITIDESNIALSGVSPTMTRLIGRLEANGSTRRLITIREGTTDVVVSNLMITRDAGVLDNGMEIGRTNPQTGTYAVERLWLHNLRVENFDGRGLNLRTAKHVLISNSWIFRAASDLEEGGNGNGIALNNQSANNVIVNCAIGPIVRHGVIIQSGAHHNLIEACDVRGSRYDCYDLHAFESQSEPLTLHEHHNELRFNVARTSTRAGFKVGNPTWGASGPGNWIHHNEVMHCERGIEIIKGSDDQVVEANYIHDLIDKDDFGPGGIPGDRRYGIWLKDGGGDSLQVRDNLFVNCRVGVGIDAGFATLIENNRFRSNEIGIETAPVPSVIRYEMIRNDLQFNTQATSLGSAPPIGGTYRLNQESSSRPRLRAADLRHSRLVGD